MSDTRQPTVVALAAGLTIFACMDVTPLEGECKQACAEATRCGLLPSALGGQAGASTAANQKDCIERCLASDDDAQQVKGLLAVLGSGNHGSESLCDPGGVDGCEELIEELVADPATNALQIDTALTIRMVSAVSFAANNAPEDLCCFDYAYDFEEEPAGGGGGDSGGMSGDGVDELAAVYDMFEPTLTCIEGLKQRLDCLGTLLDPMNMEPMDGGTPRCGHPEEMGTDGAALLCSELGQFWMPAPDNEEGMMGPDISNDPCYYARRSSRFQQEIDVTSVAQACEFQTVGELRMSLLEVTDDWNLNGGGLLVDEDATIRPLEDIQEKVLEEIREAFTGPLGFLEEACEEFFEEFGDDACTTFDRELTTCSQGPTCTPADCLNESPDCDPTFCEADVSAPGQDCSFYGIEEITLGYKTKEGLEIFADPIVGCTTRPQITATLEGVGVGVVKPIAVVSGRLGTGFSDETGGDGAFSWYAEGEPRWISAGTAEVELTSPRLEQLTFNLTNPLEFLGWVPQRLPTGQACDNQPALCEGVFNDNCEDGIDNDGDGVADSASAWCDELMIELAARCVVEIPGQVAPMECRDIAEGEEDPPPP